MTERRPTASIQHEATTRSMERVDDGEPRRDPLLESALVLALGVAGALLGAAILFFEKPWGSFDGSRHPSTHLFVRQPETIFWLCLICAETALWSVLSLPVLRSFRVEPSPKQRLGIRLSTLALIAALVGFIAVAGRNHNAYPLPHHAAKITALTAWAFLLAIVASVVIWRLHSQAARYTAMTHTPTKDDLHGLMRLQETLARMLAIQGAVIGAAVLATAALRRALVAWNEYVDAHPRLHLAHAGEIPYVYVLIYGGVFSLLLALIYFPTFVETQAAGRRIRTLSADLPAPGDQTFDEIYVRRKNLDDLLQLQVATSSSFRAGVAILAPLSTAVIGLLFKA
jgi:hypothetical protein